MNHTISSIKLKVSDKSGEVSGILDLPDTAEYLLLFAHGAGAGMTHSFMEKMSECLADENIGTLRFNFPYTEKNGNRPDHASVLMETIQTAYTSACDFAKDIPILAGGKSMGGRMTSMAASNELLPGIKGIVFFGFPLHAPGKPSSERAEHLFKVKNPMLFLQGTNDQLADLTLLKPVIENLGDKATLHIVEGADHSFKVPKSTGKSEQAILKELASKVKHWADSRFKS